MKLYCICPSHDPKFFAIPVLYGLDDEDALNAFLKTIRLVHIHREMICQDNRYYWAVAVEYLSGPGGLTSHKMEQARKKVDYEEELSPEDFVVFTTKLNQRTPKLSVLTIFFPLFQRGKQE